MLLDVVAVAADVAVAVADDGDDGPHVRQPLPSSVAAECDADACAAEAEEHAGWDALASA